MRYRAWADLARSLAVAEEAFGRPVPWESPSIFFFLPIPPSWSRKKREAHKGEPHRQKPDLDNLLKAVMDALLPNDQGVWKIRRLEKRWDDGKGPRVEIE